MIDEEEEEGWAERYPDDPDPEGEASQEGDSEKEEDLNEIAQATEMAFLIPPEAPPKKGMLLPTTEEEADVEAIKEYVVDPGKKIHVADLRWDKQGTYGQARPLDKRHALTIARSIEESGLPRLPIFILVVQSTGMRSQSDCGGECSLFIYQATPMCPLGGSM